jgi:hypothetical protein
MKEKRMEENAQTEQELLEEQLQAITGGCKDCNSNRGSINGYQRGIRIWTNRLGSPDPQIRQKAARKIADLNEKIQQETNIIWQRHPLDLNYPPDQQPQQPQQP